MKEYISTVHFHNGQTIRGMLVHGDNIWEAVRDFRENVLPIMEKCGEIREFSIVETGNTI